MATVFEELRVYPEHMRRNLERTRGLPLAERLVGELTRAGLPREDAHEAVRTAAMRAIETESDLAVELGKDERVTEHLDAKKIQALMDPAGYTGSAGETVDRVLKEATRYQAG